MDVTEAIEVVHSALIFPSDDARYPKGKLDEAWQILVDAANKGAR